MLKTFRNLCAERGPFEAVAYSIGRLLGKTGGLAALHRYAPVGQPVGTEPLLTRGRGGSIIGACFDQPATLDSCRFGKARP